MQKKEKEKIVQKNINKDTSLFFSEDTKCKLYCLANGKCQNPDCKMSVDFKGGCAEFAHIYGREPGSARYFNKKSAKFICSLKNGLLLCCNCHTIIDKNANKFTVNILQEWKNGNTQKKIYSAVGYSFTIVEASVNTQ